MIAYNNPFSILLMLIALITHNTTVIANSTHSKNLFKADL